MKFLPLWFLFMCVYWNSLAQYFHVVLTDGTKIEITDIQSGYSETVSYVKAGAREKFKVLKTDIDYYSISDEVWYRTCSTPSTNSCGFHKRIVNGTIEVFGGQNIYTIGYDEIVVRKQGQTAWDGVQNVIKVSGTDRSNLRELIKDDSDILRRFDEGRRLNDEEIVQLVREYNIRNYSVKEVSKSSEGRIVVYLKSKKPPEYPIQITVNDTSRYDLPFATLVSVKLYGDPCNVCIAGACGLLSPSFRVPYIEVSIDNKTKKVHLRQVQSQDAIRYINFLKER